MNKDKWLVVMLSCFMVGIVGLTVAIIVVRLSNNEEKLLCLDLNDERDQSRCLERLLEEKGLGEARKSYDKIFDLQMNNKNYKDAVALKIDWMDSLTDKEQCDEVGKLLDDERIEQATPNELFEYYGSAIESAELCDDEAKSDELWSKYYKLGNSGQVTVVREKELIDGVVDDRPEEEKGPEYKGGESE